MLLLIPILFLTGCGNQKEATKNSSQSSPTESQQVDTTTENLTSSTTATKEETTVTTDSSQASSQAPVTPQTATEELLAAFPENNFPTNIPSEASYLNINVTDSGDTLAVLYYGGTQAFPLNDPSLRNETAFASYQKVSYQSLNSAQQAVNPIFDNGGKSLDLGYGITGYQQGAAGSTYLNWQEGNWNLSVRGGNDSQQNPQELAKEMVTYLETAYLPAPKTVGQITVDLLANNATVSWQVDQIVYTITHSDPLSALAMTVSTNH